MSNYNVVSHIFGKHSEHNNLLQARQVVSQLNADLFETMVYRPLVEMKFVFSMGYERGLNDNYALSAYYISQD